MARNANTPITYDSPSRGYGGSSNIADAIFTFPAATVAANSTFTLFVIPKNSRLVRTSFRADDADSNGTPNIAFSVGDAGNAARYLSASTIARTGGSVQTTLDGALNFVFTQDTPIILTITAAAATQTAGAQIYSLFEYVEA